MSSLYQLHVDRMSVCILVNAPLVLVGTTGQEIGRCLTRLVLPSETEHVFTSTVGRSKVDLLTLVDQEDLVELLVNTFTSLIQGDERRHFAIEVCEVRSQFVVRSICHASADHSRDVGQGPDTFGIVERGRGVETTRGVVPGKDTTLTTESLGDRDTLPLSTRDTSNKLVTDKGVGSVLNVEHLEQGAEEFFTELLLRNTAGKLARGLASEGGLDGLLDSQGGQVLIICCITAKENRR